MSLPSTNRLRPLCAGNRSSTRRGHYHTRVNRCFRRGCCPRFRPVLQCLPSHPSRWRRRQSWQRRQFRPRWAHPLTIHLRSTQRHRWRCGHPTQYRQPWLFRRCSCHRCSSGHRWRSLQCWSVRPQPCLRCPTVHRRRPRESLARPRLPLRCYFALRLWRQHLPSQTPRSPRRRTLPKRVAPKQVPAPGARIDRCAGSSLRKLPSLSLRVRRYWCKRATLRRAPGCPTAAHRGGSPCLGLGSGRIEPAAAGPTTRSFAGGGIDWDAAKCGRVCWSR